MRELSKRLFDVCCKGCGRRLVTVERLRDTEIAMLADHLRGCSASPPLGHGPRLGAIMACIRVATNGANQAETTTRNA